MSLCHQQHDVVEFPPVLAKWFFMIPLGISSQIPLRIPLGGCKMRWVKRPSPASQAQVGDPGQLATILDLAGHLRWRFLW